MTLSCEPLYCPRCGREECACPSGDGWEDVQNGKPILYCEICGVPWPCRHCKDSPDYDPRAR